MSLADRAAEARMPFMSHLGELRTRVFNSVIGIFVASMVTFFFRNELYALLAYPLAQAWIKTFGPDKPIALHYTSPVEVFMAPFKLSLVAAIFVGSPVVFHQIWRFISPGLYPRERRYAFPFIVGAFALFIGGAAFAYLYVLPASYSYFLSYTTNQLGVIHDFFGRQVDLHLVKQAIEVKPMITMDEYLSLTSMLLLVFGAVFELPLILCILAMFGIVTPGMLWRFNRFAILISFVAGAVLTPGDLVVGQIAMGVALTVLYNLSIVVALIVGRKRKTDAAEDALAATKDDEPQPLAKTS